MEDHKVKKTIDSKSITIIILSFVLVIVTMLVIFLIILIQYDKKNRKKSEPKDIEESMVTTVVTTEASMEASNIVTTPLPEMSTITETSAITTAKTLPDSEMYDYTEFDTSLVVKVDDAETLPLRDMPDRYESNIILQIPDGITVHVLGYKDTGTEIWFRVEYDESYGWCRGGMLQPYSISLFYEDLYDRPSLEKWKSKFRIQEPTSRNYLGSAKFKGTVYFIPDFSSGVETRLKSPVTVEIYAALGDWYYVEINDSLFYGIGWVYKDQLSFEQ